MAVQVILSPGSNQLDSQNGATNASYQYDADGNLISDGTHTYQYDARNRLVGVDNAVSFALNGLGQRVEKRSSKRATLYLYGLNGQLIARTDPAGRTEREFIYVNGVPAAVLVYRSVGNTAQAGTGIAHRSANASNTPAAAKGNTPTVAGHGGSKVLPQSPTGLYYIHTDHLGTPRVITDPSTGQVVWRWDGEPFGASAPNEDPNGSGSNFVFNLRFPGQYYDAQTGLDYNYYRDYDPRTGRYVESDPSGLWGGLNTYGYVYGNPLILLDLYGLQIFRYPGNYYTDQYQGPGAMVPVTIGGYIMGWKPYSPADDEAGSWPACVAEYPYPLGGTQDNSGTDNNKGSAKGGSLPWWHVFGPTGNSAADLASDQCSLGALLGFGGEQGLHRGAEGVLGDSAWLKVAGALGLARQIQEQYECAQIKLNPGKYGY
ncbi:MAG: RHS repeat-associated core domain-containing protein [Pseudolabrys sp.]